MKALIVLISLYSSLSLAQSVDIKDVDTNGSENTTIEIKKGKKGEAPAGERNWEITEGDADVQGEVATMSKEARASWKKACEDWKKEFRADNKENKIILIDCGRPDCSGDATNKTCVSKAKYKVKTKIN